jgi:hypothetical protein
LPHRAVSEGKATPTQALIEAAAYIDMALAAVNAAKRALYSIPAEEIPA